MILFVIFQAVQQYGDIDIFTADFRPLKSTLSGLPDRVFMKVVVSAKTNKVLGLHMCGEDAPEIIQVFRVVTAALYCLINYTWNFNSLDMRSLDAQGFAIAIKAGLTKADFDATVGVHPSAAEEFVTMRTPTRRIRKSQSSEVSRWFFHLFHLFLSMCFLSRILVNKMNNLVI